ncbi:MAG: DegV family protein [Clostridia bacterium]|nr:DegV family protein [Clostridia bacterium]
MSKFIISVEATSDINKKIAEKYDIAVAPMNFMVDQKEYSSADETMSPEIFYNSMKSGAKTTTSQVNTFQAKQFFENLLKEGKDILHISFSSALSGTCSNMKSVAEELNKTSANKIIVVDSLAASMGQAFIAILARLKENEVETVAELAQYAETIKLKMGHLFVVDALKYLSRTGRISKVTAAIGSVLQIKPILHVDNEGHLTSKAKVISRKKSLINLAEMVAKNKNNDSDMIFITHANCLEETNTVAKLIEEKTGITPEILELGYVIGCHAGPGTIAVFYTTDAR